VFISLQSCYTTRKEKEHSLCKEPEQKAYIEALNRYQRETVITKKKKKKYHAALPYSHRSFPPFVRVDGYTAKSIINDN